MMMPLVCILSILLLCTHSVNSLLGPGSAATSVNNRWPNRPRKLAELFVLPKDIKFKPEQIEILRIIGKMDIQIDRSTFEEARKEIDRISDPEIRQAMQQWDSPVKQGRATSVRVFEARIPGGTKCFLKEYLPIGLPFGRRELTTTRKLSARWNAKLNAFIEESAKDSTLRGNLDDAINNDYTQDSPFTAEASPLNTLMTSLGDMSNMVEDRSQPPAERGSSPYAVPTTIDGLEVPPFPTLLGSLRPDTSIESPTYRRQWAKRFPRSAPPTAGNLWLVFKWDEATFRAVKRYPPLPQIVEGLDYFRKDARDTKRWRFMRKIMRKALEAVDYLHRSGFCHNAVSAESLWLTTTNQLEIDALSVKFTDLGVSQRFADLGPYAREAAVEDLYQLGLVLLELVVSSFNDDSVGAQIARTRLTGQESGTKALFYRREDVDLSQLSQREWQSIYEKLCDSDFQTLRNFVGSISNWAEALNFLERDNGACWRLIFNLLSRGRLYDEDRQKPLKVTGSKLIREYASFFEDTYADGER